MSPSELADRLETIISRAEERFGAAILDSQKMMYADMVVLLKDLQLDAEGYIRNSAANRKLIQRAGTLFNSSLETSGYYGAINQYVSNLQVISQANAIYFAAISESFSPNRQFISSLQRQTVEALESTLLNEGLAANVKQPLLSILNQNVNSGGSFSGMLDQVKSYIVGEGRQGTLMRHARTWTADSLFNFSRSYQQAVSSDLGLEFYFYSGGVVKDSRDFCRERHDQYFHQKEIQAWAALDWQGKNPNTTESSIFIYAGGYSCRHSMIPVHKSVVPDEVKGRAV